MMQTGNENDPVAVRSSGDVKASTDPEVCVCVCVLGGGGGIHTSICCRFCRTGFLSPDRRQYFGNLLRDLEATLSVITGGF
jgi:hypothetical protein